MKDELREAAEIAGTRAFPAHPHFRGMGADLYIAGYEAGKQELAAELKELREFVGAMNPGSEICFKGVVFHLCLDGKWRSDMARSGTSGNMRYMHQGYDTALDAWRKMNAGEDESR